ncbi:MAG: dihydropteroate synthase [Phycisphaerales bacterium]|nr:MAG: dihydropteroate synthase [Phycisphaerales bacterium]
MDLILRHSRVDPSTYPLVMGILNVTPDSFSDGGDYFEPKDAVARALEMIEDGADIIDIGGESTRPGASDVPEDEQIKRTVPVVESIRARNNSIPISIDTCLSTVAHAALEAGADVINDISAFRDDPEMVELAARTGVPVVLMHRKGKPATMQQEGGPQYDDVITEVCDFLRERVAFAVNRGLDPSKLILDPGIGFGKRVEHNLSILRNLGRFVALGQPVLVGASRKSFIGNVLESAIARGDGSAKYRENPRQREAASLACAAMAVGAGAAIIRAHDVRSTVEVVRLSAAVRQAT